MAKVRDFPQYSVGELRPTQPPVKWIMGIIVPAIREVGW
jgi:hypothetical protein